MPTNGKRKVYGFTLDSEHVALIDAVSQANGDTGRAAALRYILDEYRRLQDALRLTRPAIQPVQEAKAA